MKIGFELRKIRLALEDILPMRQLKAPEKNIHRYKTIMASIKVVGLVEPLVVYPQKDAPGKFMLKNGHLRYFALKDLGETAADCIIVTDDECYTYNARISRLPPIQEHKMIVKAVNSGVSPERLAAALNLPLRVVQASLNLLNGIHADAAELLKDKNISP
jgi:ParB-like chromosome segregation protein Spo0J